MAPQRSSDNTLGRHRLPPGDSPTKTGTEKANESVEKKQDKEGGEKGPAITTIFSPHQGHGWRGETRENRAALSLAGEGRAAERREWAPVAGRPPECPAAGDGDLNAPHPPSVFPCGAIPLLPNKPINSRYLHKIPTSLQSYARISPWQIVASISCAGQYEG